MIYLIAGIWTVLVYFCGVAAEKRKRKQLLDELEYTKNYVLIHIPSHDTRYRAGYGAAIDDAKKSVEILR